MRLTYERGGEEVVIGKPRTINGAFKQMKKYLKDNNFKSYYMRINMFTEENKLWIDFGSHVSFFNLYDLTKSNWNELLNNNQEERGK